MRNREGNLRCWLVSHAHSTYGYHRVSAHSATMIITGLYDTPLEMIHYFVSGDWQRLFEPSRRQRGLQYFKAGNIIDELDISASVESDYCFIDTVVTGNKKYSVSIELEHDLDPDCYCECPDKKSHLCKHLAAVFYKMQNQCQLFLEQKRELTGIIDEALEPANPGPHPDQWLEKLATLHKDPKHHWQDKQLEEFAPHNKQRLAYVLCENYLGVLTLETRKARLDKDGQFIVEAKSIEPQISRGRRASYLAKVDLQILRMIDAYRSLYASSLSVDVSDPVFPELLKKCIATGRCVLDAENSSSPRIIAPLKWAADRKLILSWKSDDEGRVKPALEVVPEIDIMIPSEPKLYYDHLELAVGGISQEYSNEFLDEWLEGPALAPERADKLREKIKKSSIPDVAAIPAPPQQVVIENVLPTPILRVSRHDASAAGSFFKDPGLTDILMATVAFDYAGVPVAMYPQMDIQVGELNGKITTVHRNLELEDAAAIQLDDAGLAALKYLFRPEHLSASMQRAFAFHSNNNENTSRWVQFLATSARQLEAKGWLIETYGELGYQLVENEEYYEELNESQSGNQWFEFELGVEYQGQRISLIPALAHALKSGMDESLDEENLGDSKIPVQVDEKGTFILFPAKRFKLILDKLRDLFNHVNDDDVIEMPKLRAATLADELDLAKTNQTHQALAELGRQLTNIKEIPKAKAPKNLVATLRDYQLEGFQWLQFLAKYQLNGILADDMGLGKTIQTLAHILAEKNGRRNNRLPSLIVAPTSVIPNWQAEAAKFTPSLKVLMLHGSDRAARFKDIAKHDIVITSYALLHRDQQVHRRQLYHNAVLDESQYIKNHKTQTSQAAYQINANHRICLSGTPMENHLGELWSCMYFLMPGLLESAQRFHSTFRTPIERHNDHTALQTLHRRVAPLILRRTKEKVARELPAKTIIPHYITLSKTQVDLYESVRATMDKRVRKAIKEKGLSKSHIIVLDALLKLRQICCHPQLLKTTEAQKIESSAKLDYLSQLLATLIEEDRRILIFSQFTTMLEKIENHLVSERIPFVKITGSTRDRKTPVELFQSGQIPVFLISLKAGGTGLNLTAADTVIHYDPWWNPASENQATDRAYRIGQTKPVFVHKLICQGTIEQRIQVLQEKKAKLVESLLGNATEKLHIDQAALSGLLAPID